MRTNVVPALVDVVATKLGIILLSFGPSGVRVHERCVCAGGRSGH